MMNDNVGKIVSDKRPSFISALVAFLCVLATIALARFVFSIDLHVVMILSIVVAGISAMVFGLKWKDILSAMIGQIGRTMEALIIFMLVGAVIGTFISSGAVPALIYYGLDIINPSWFLPAGFIIACLTSLATGTSWGTIGTIGIALLAIGSGLGVPAPITVGMIAGGAFFGDKMSPVSDTTNLAAGISETPLYRHITTMMYAAVPAAIISIIIYALIGFKYGADNINLSDVELMRATLAGTFNLNILVFLPLIVLLVLSVKKFPAIPTMLISVFIAVIVDAIFQGTNLASALSVINGGFSSDTGVAAVDSLLSRGGIQSMMWTISLVLLTLCLGGILEKSKVLETVIEGVSKRAKKPGSLMLVSIICSIIGLMATGVIYFTLSLNGRLLKKPFDDMDLDESMLSRSLEEGGTMFDPLIPWTTSGIFISSTLGVSTIQYFPYVFNSFLTPVISVILCYMGISVLMKDKVTLYKKKKKNIA